MSLPPDAPRPRLCHIIKSNPEQEYGFDLHAEKVKGQFIGNVDDDSPAGLAGLRRGDRIIAVNGISIAQENHKDVVKRIKEDPMQCRMVVLDEDGVAWYNERKLTIPIEGDHVIDVFAEREAANANKEGVHHHHQHSAHLPPTYNDVVHEKQSEDEQQQMHHVVPHHEEDIAVSHVGAAMSNLAVAEETQHHKIPHFDIANDSHHGNNNNAAFKPRPRLCKLTKTKTGDEYGFNLHAEKGKGHFIGKVDNDSIAERAGLEEGQRIVGVNNTLIYPNTPHKDVVGLIKQDTASTELLVVFPEIDNWYRQKEMEFSFDDAETVSSSVDEPAQKRHVGINGQINGNVVSSHAEQPHHIPREHKEEVPIFTPSSLSENSHVNGPTHHKEEVVAAPVYHEESKPVYHEESKPRSPPEPVELPRHYEAPSAPMTHSHVPTPQHGAPGDMFNLSAAEMKERLSRQKKTDPRKSETGSMSLRQKYDIIQSL